MPFTFCFNGRCFDVPILVQRDRGPEPDPRTVAIQDAVILTTIDSLVQGLSRDVRQELARSIGASVERLQAMLPPEMTLSHRSEMAQAV